MQFEGNWTPVTDIVVDKVGKYAYVIGSMHDAAATPVVMDVVLDVRTKVWMFVSHATLHASSFAPAVPLPSCLLCCLHAERTAPAMQTTVSALL